MDCALYLQWDKKYTFWSLSFRCLWLQKKLILVSIGSSWRGVSIKVVWAFNLVEKYISESLNLVLIWFNFDF